MAETFINCIVSLLAVEDGVALECGFFHVEGLFQPRVHLRVRRNSCSAQDLLYTFIFSTDPLSIRNHLPYVAVNA